MNFLVETLEVIKDSGHKQSDVMFIGSKDGEYRATMKEFKKLANFEYDDGFGAAEIASDLIIYFKDKSYIGRGEYDGSEWWEYNEPLNLKEDKDSKKISNFTGMWSSMRDIHCQCGNPKGECVDLCDECLDKTSK